MEREIKIFPEMKVAFVRHVGDYADCSEAFETLLGWADDNDLINDDTVFLGICHDNPNAVPEDECRYDACISISDDNLKLEDGISIKTLPNTKCLSVMHKGSYDELFDTYNEIYSGPIAKEYSLKLQEPCIEVYKNSPEEVDEEDLLTELYIPIN